MLTLLDDLSNVPGASIYYHSTHQYRTWHGHVLTGIRLEQGVFVFMVPNNDVPLSYRSQKIVMSDIDLDRICVWCRQRQTQLVANILGGCWAASYNLYARCSCKYGIAALRTQVECKYISSRLQRRQS